MVFLFRKNGAELIATFAMGCLPGRERSFCSDLSCRLMTCAAALRSLT